MYTRGAWRPSTPARREKGKGRRLNRRAPSRPKRSLIFSRAPNAMTDSGFDYEEVMRKAEEFRNMVLQQQPSTSTTDALDALQSAEAEISHAPEHAAAPPPSQAGAKRKIADAAAPAPAAPALGLH